jgi:hypothetical protein
VHVKALVTSAHSIKIEVRLHLQQEYKQVNEFNDCNNFLCTRKAAVPEQNASLTTTENNFYCTDISFTTTTKKKKQKKKI